MKFDSHLLRAASELQLRAKRNVTALLAGNYKTAFRGSGMQFKDFRHYEPGDDIRHMSWLVTARTGKATVKTYEEDRELDVLLMVDVSGSALFGMHGQRKIDMYAKLVALIGLASLHSGDNVGLLLFNDKPVSYLPPRQTQDQVFVSVRQVLEQPLRGAKSDLRPALLHAQNVLKNRSLILILSDFLLPKFEKELRILSIKHEIVMLQCLDEAERGSTIEGVYEVWDPETEKFYLLDANSKANRKAFLDYYRQLGKSLEDLSRRSKSDYLRLSVEDDYIQRLVRFFRKRGPSRL